MENSISFDTILLQTGNNTGIRVPDDVIQQLGAGKKPPVLVTINHFTYPSTVGVMSGVYMIPVSSAVRQSAGVKGGDFIRVILRLDAEPRVVAVPLDVQQALDVNQGAKAFFESLSPSGKKKVCKLD